MKVLKYVAREGRTQVEYYADIKFPAGKKIFSSPEQSSGRAIALPPVSALEKCSSFTLKF